MCRIIKAALLGLLFLAFPLHAGVLILTPDNTTAHHIAEKLKTKIASNDIEIKTALPVGRDFDLIITVGFSPFSKLSYLPQNLTAPVIASFISRHDYSQVKNMKSTTAIFIDPNPEDQLALVKKIFGKAKVGYIYTQDDPYLHDLKDIEKKYEIQIDAIQINNDIFRTLRSIGDQKDINAFLINYNSNLYTSDVISYVLEVFYRLGIPVIAFSKALVDAGAVAASHTDETQVIELTAKTINDYLKTKQLVSPFYSNKTGISVNHRLARTYNIDAEGVENE